MTIANNYAPVVQAANGSTTVISATWNALSASYVKMQLLNTTTGLYTTVTQGLASNQFQVTTLTPTSLVCTFNTAPAAGNNIVLSRLTPPTQIIPYTTSRGFQGSVEEGSFDALTNMVQELGLQVADSIQVSIGDTAANLTLPIVSLRANLFLAFDASGNVIATPGTAGPQGPSGNLPMAVGSGTDTITATFAPAIVLANSPIVAVLLAGSNLTTNPTLNGNGTGAKTITKKGGAALGIGDLPAANTYAIFGYYPTGNRWELMNPAPAGLASAQTFNAAQRGIVNTLAYAATLTPDFSTGNNFLVDLTGNMVLGTPTNLAPGQDGYFRLRQDATGSRLGTYSWAWGFSGGNVPTLSTAGATADDLYYSVKVAQSAVVTITLATPGVITYTAHGLQTGQQIQLTTTGTLPTGLSPSTTYYVINTGANTFTLATTLANAAAGTAIATSVSQSGVHTCTAISIAANLVTNVA